MENKQNANQIMEASKSVVVTVNEFAAKFRTKRQIYNLLTIDSALYLPSYGTYSILAFLMFFFCSRRANKRVLPQGRRLREEEE